METKNPGDKTLSVAPKKATLGLKRGVERDTVRQSFSHGRTNTVQVERKKRRLLPPGEGRSEPSPPLRTPEPAMAGQVRVHVIRHPPYRLAAWDKREHQWTLTPVLPDGH